MNFRNSEKVVCISDAWEMVGPGFRIVPADGPKKDEVCEVNGVKEVAGELYLSLNEWSEDLFEAKYFRKLHDDMVESIIKQVTKRPVEIS